MHGLHHHHQGRVGHPQRDRVHIYHAHRDRHGISAAGGSGVQVPELVSKESGEEGQGGS